MKVCIYLMLFKVTLIFPQEVEGDRPFNLVTHFYKPIKALKCDQGSPQIYSNRWSMCKKEKVQKYLIKKNVDRKLGPLKYFNGHLTSKLQ